MNTDIQSRILQTTGSREITEIEHIQPLWNNYGMLSRVYLRGNPAYPSVIVKHIQIDNRHILEDFPAIFPSCENKTYQVEYCINIITDLSRYFILNTKVLGCFDNEMDHSVDGGSQESNT